MTVSDQVSIPRAAGTGIRAIESDHFPIDFVSKLALRESWRKEIYRPMYYTHKWWARRLGSVFRAIVVGCVVPPDADFRQAFYRPGSHPDVSILDPFMGSGTTIGESHKIGCTSFGMDINPVACEAVRVSMSSPPREKIMAAFNEVAFETRDRIRSLYKTRDSDGRQCDVLYFFWVKQVQCPGCGSGVSLFPTYAFARTANPLKARNVHVVCPECWDIFPWRKTANAAACPSCSHTFEPDAGSARGASATCRACRRKFAVVDSVRSSKSPPEHRLYGKLVLTADGEKRYAKATREDAAAYAKCSIALRSAVGNGEIKLPRTELADGHNTRQAINYNYRTWREFFNDRQLLSLGWLQSAIWRIGDAACRDALLLLFSGTLEFNNMFASYKGEGTGAVRHMFAHHILKPERMPLEANVWGTEKSSGSFSGLFRSRLLRALDYKREPFELGAEDRKTPSSEGALKWGVGALDRRRPEPGGIKLACGSSDKMDLDDGAIDYVVTDPPFFDNVNYSELADFFYSWGRLYPRGFIGGGDTTRDKKEVQDSNPGRFAAKLAAVFSECHRVLADEGLLVFTYHHSRPDGWTSVHESLARSGFVPVGAHPVKAEMSVSVPMTQSRSPIQLDVIFVCKKRACADSEACGDAAAAAVGMAQHKARLLGSAGLNLSRADVRTVLYSQFMVTNGRGHDGSGMSEECFLELESRARESGLGLHAIRA